MISTDMKYMLSKFYDVQSTAKPRKYSKIEGDGYLSNILRGSNALEADKKIISFK